jgi:regulator of protease activity HflC (stomatin/prohibitin superfamily)
MVMFSNKIPVVNNNMKQKRPPSSLVKDALERQRREVMEKMAHGVPRNLYQTDRHPSSEGFNEKFRRYMEQHDAEARRMKLEAEAAAEAAARRTKLEAEAAAEAAAMAALLTTPKQKTIRELQEQLTPAEGPLADMKDELGF